MNLGQEWWFYILISSDQGVRQSLSSPLQSSQMPSAQQRQMAEEKCHTKDTGF